MFKYILFIIMFLTLLLPEPKGCEVLIAIMNGVIVLGLFSVGYEIHKEIK